MARTDTERLDFIICHQHDLPNSLGFADDPRAVLDVLIDQWDKRLGDIARGAIKPSQEEPRKFADAGHPRGYFRPHVTSKDFPPGSDTREALERQEKLAQETAWEKATERKP